MKLVSMRKLLRISKVTRVFRLKELLNDVHSGVEDDDILDKYRITRKQLGRIYSKLFYGGHLTERDIVRRIAMRGGKDSSYIPYAEFQGSNQIYECLTCGFSSMLHFSACPRCQQLNLRRLSRRQDDSIANTEALLAHFYYQMAP
jgi:hypothetical protein